MDFLKKKKRLTFFLKMTSLGVLGGSLPWCQSPSEDSVITLMSQVNQLRTTMSC